MHFNYKSVVLLLVVFSIIAISSYCPRNVYGEERKNQMNIVKLIANIRSGVAQILIIKEQKPISSGTAFLVQGGLITNSHVIRDNEFDTIAIRLTDTDPADPRNYISLKKEELKNIIVKESLKDDKDYVYLTLSNSKFTGRHVFEFADSSSVSVGEQVVFLGFPFGDNHLTAHIGYISGIYEQNKVKTLQIDGSVNGGNSGGPLIDIKTGKVVGIVTKRNIGFIAKQFEELIKALQYNQQALAAAQTQGQVQLLGINPLEAIQKSQTAMEQIARDLFNSANVGIGYAYISDYARDEIEKYANRKSPDK
jgi:hypothetical protein